MKKISVVLATHNEEKNIGACLESVRQMADEIVVVDGSSTDKTGEVAKSLGAKVIETTNPPIFHINKQKALEAASEDWILQLDADERVSPELSQEIKKVIEMSDKKLEEYQQNLPKRRVFLKHQTLLDKRDGSIGTKKGPYAAFFLPRLNYFLGKFLKYGGVYPDGVIRLVKSGKAHFPAKSVHEQIVVQGKVGWLKNPLLHYDSPTFKRYLERNSRYIDLLKSELEQSRVGKNLFQGVNYFVIKPIFWFLMTQIRHKGILDGAQGIIFSFFSALRFPRAYWGYITKLKMTGETLKIYIDASPLQSGHKVRGIGAYTRNLIEALRNREKVRLVSVPGDADIIHYPYFDPFFNTLSMSKNKPVIVTIYDTIPLIYPKHYPVGIKGKLNFLAQKKKLKRVDAVITISETSKKDIVRFLDIQGEKIHPIHLAPPHKFKKISEDTLIHMGVSRRYRLPERFVLYVGDVNYNKNVKGLLRAFALLLANKNEPTNQRKRVQVDEKVSLVLVGKAFKDDIPETREILQLIKELNLEDMVIMPGFIPGDDLTGIYNLATVYCQPSFYEGFGLPVLEAMACGTPVAAAKTQALVEIAEGKVCFFDPEDPEDIMKVLSGIVDSPPLRKKLSKDGILHSNKFSWDKVADETIKVYKKVVA